MALRPDHRRLGWPAASALLSLGALSLDTGGHLFPSSALASVRTCAESWAWAVEEEAQLAVPAEGVGGWEAGTRAAVEQCSLYTCQNVVLVHSGTDEAALC